MAFNAIFQFKPDDEAGKNRWLLEHYLEHMNMYRALLEQTPSVQTVNYPIATMDDEREWLAAHQEMSQSVWSGAGGGQSIDLGRVDWSDETQFLDWCNLHRNWHSSVRASLGL